MPNPRLEVGKPTQTHPASFTQFILPFAYRLECVGECAESRESGGPTSSPTVPLKAEVEQNATDAKANDESESANQKTQAGPSIAGGKTKEPQWMFRSICCCIPNLSGNAEIGKGCSCGSTQRLDGIKERLDYLTSETGNVLFERAKWFHLAVDEAGREQRFSSTFEVGVHGKPICVVVDSVQLVLFEFPEGINDSQKADKPIMLQIGFLILETRFKRGQEVSLHHLCNFNELFRYIDKPWPEHFDEIVHGSDKFIEHTQLHKLHRSEGGNRGERYQTGGLEEQFYGKMHRFLTLYRISWGGRNFKISGLEEDSMSRRDQKNVFPDNRAFVWTCAIAARGELRRITGDGHWAKFLNVDQMSPCYSGASTITRFEEEWLKKRTYRRWAHYGTLYGFTSHSGAMLGYGNRNPPTHMHFKQMYLDQILLLLYLRSGLFRFSAMLNEMTSEAQSLTSSGNGKAEWERKFIKTRWEFTVFTNLYQFPMLSNQQQSLEMYSMTRENMEVKELFEEVQEEIHNSHDYLQQKNSRNQAEIVQKLTWIATIFIPATFVTSFLGMDQEWAKPLTPVVGQWIAEAPYPHVLLFFVTVIISLIGYTVIANYLKRDSDRTE
jgi:hypothetical protein